MFEKYFFSCRKRNVRAVKFYIHPNLIQSRIFLEHIINIYDDFNWLSQSLIPSLSRHWLISFRKTPFLAYSDMHLSLCSHVKSPSVMFPYIFSGTFLVLEKDFDSPKGTKFLPPFSRQEFKKCDLKALAKCHDYLQQDSSFLFSSRWSCSSDIRSVGEFRGRHVPFAQECINSLADRHCLFLYRCPYLRIHYKSQTISH